jgi:hypothetical protein
MFRLRRSPRRSRRYGWLLGSSAERRRIAKMMLDLAPARGKHSAWTVPAALTSCSITSVWSWLVGVDECVRSCVMVNGRLDLGARCWYQGRRTSSTARRTGDQRRAFGRGRRGRAHPSRPSFLARRRRERTRGIPGRQSERRNKAVRTLGAETKERVRVRGSARSGSASERPADEEHDERVGGKGA